MPSPCRAIVTSAPRSDGQPSFVLENLSLRDLRDDECLIEVVATGLCHTDIAIAARPNGVFPRVLGHEGSGYVRKIGAKVGANTVPPTAPLREGDPVLLSFAFCGSCTSCQSGHPAYCVSSFALCFNDCGPAYTRRTESAGGDGDPVAGGFFGQSSLGNLAVVKENCIVNMSGVVKDREELKLFAPLGCGFQTGAATVSILAQAKPSDSVAIIGLGGVGLAGIMVAKIIGCKQIIAIDRVEEKLRLAKELGATVLINNEICPAGFSEAVRTATNGAGSSITIDTTGALPVIQQALDMTSVLGKMVLLGMSGASIEVDITKFKMTGKTLLGSVQGDAVASVYVLQMIQWYREGLFPIDRLIKFYRAEDVNLALKDMKVGKTVKPIILWEEN
ncbi:Polyketide synthase, enoylreductase domain [Fusarium oxysporum f. sp. vasinfectum]|nr:Polyketide synthase, enoylreductase domain [Fusarium oxysporum f. sp. vasinfectum]